MAQLRAGLFGEVAGGALDRCRRGRDVLAVEVRADDAGDLGPVYGKQWRDWEAADGRHIDQIAELVRTMLDGIGHYACEIQPGGSSAHVTCDNPYPCDLDRGIIAGFAARFEPAVAVSHATSACRTKGDGACVYLVQW